MSVNDDDILERKNVFNEDTLREEIVKVWGNGGAHIDVYDTLLKIIKNQGELIDNIYKHSANAPSSPTATRLLNGIAFSIEEYREKFPFFLS